jgi:hypothetical protein
LNDQSRKVEAIISDMDLMEGDDDADVDLWTQCELCNKWRKGVQGEANVHI